jgi:hypothetical protein
MNKINKIAMMLLAFSFCFNAFASIDIKFNHDVFKCGEVVKHPVSFEAPAEFLQNSKIDIPEDKIQNAITLLKKISPERGRVLENLIADKTNIKFIKNVDIQRSSPISVLMMPEGCSLGILTQVKMNIYKYEILISANLYERMQPRDQIFFWLHLLHDMEQSLQIMNKNIDQFDQIQAKEFIACMFSSGCRPLSLKDMHKLAKTRLYGLSFLEQDGLLIDARLSVLFYPNGLIKQYESIFYLRDIPEAMTLFKTQITILGKIAKKSYGPMVNKKWNVFTEEGKLKCANVALDDQIKFKKFGANSVWISDYLFPLCWNERGEVTQGHLWEDFSQPFFYKENDHQIKMAPPVYDNNPNGDSIDNDSTGSSFVFYPDGKPNFMFNVRGKVRHLGKDFEISEFVQFYPSGRVKCTKFKSVIKFGSVNYDPDSSKPIVCFDEAGAVSKLYEKFEFYDLIANEFIQ